MLPILCATLAVAFLTPSEPPKAGHYYRAELAEQVANGTFDPDAYATHRAPSIRWTAPRATVDHGQATATWTLRPAGKGWEAREAGGSWRPVVIQALGPDRLVTDLAGELETWVRLPYAFAELVDRTRAERLAVQRAALVGRYVAADGSAIVLGKTTGFKLVRCLESCSGEARAWCVTHRRNDYVVADGGALVEIERPAGVCPVAPAFTAKIDGRRFERL